MLPATECGRLHRELAETFAALPPPAKLPDRHAQNQGTLIAAQETGPENIAPEYIVFVRNASLPRTPACHRNLRPSGSVAAVGGSSVCTFSRICSAALRP